TIAAEVARKYGTEHHRIEVNDEEAISMVREAVNHLDLPSVDAINSYIVAKKVSEAGIKCALSGLGADELFGGYPSFHDVPRLRQISRLPKLARHLLRFFGPTGERLAEVPDGDLSELTRWRRRFWTDRMLQNAGFEEQGWESAPMPELRDSFAIISWVELTTYMRH